MQPISSSTLLTAQQWRYATKQFDASKQIPADQWAALEQTLVLTPSSFGLQPWRFVTVSDPATRARLREHSWGQAQVTDASHLVVFAARTECSAADIAHYVDRVAEVRGQPAAALAAFRQMLEGAILNEDRKSQLFGWAARQAYIAMGQLMTAAALLGIDTCPMEGLEPAKFDELLELRKEGFATLATVALGYRGEGDKYATLPKVRYPKAEVVKTI